MRGWVALAIPVLLSTAAMVAGSACKSGDSEPDPAAQKAQQDLLARRDALIAARGQLKKQKDELATKIEAGKAAGSNTAELEKQLADVDKQINNDEDFKLVNQKLDALKVDKDSSIALRERDVADRERQLADRERQLADREARAASREQHAADREVAADQRAQTCVASAPAQTIIQMPAPTKGSSYAASDVQPLLQRAQTTMAKKQLMQADLGPAAGLQSEALAAMKANDWGKAYLAANQLALTVDSIKVDREFIRNKVERFNAAETPHRAGEDAATKKQIADVNVEVTKNFTDGNYAGANQRLNQLFGLLK